MNSTTQTPDNVPHSTDVIKSSRFALSIAFLALFFTVIGITAGYKHWMRIHVKSKAALHEISTLKQQVAQKADKQALDSLIASINSTNNKGQEQLDSALKQLDIISKKTDYTSSTLDQQVTTLTRLQTQQNPQQASVAQANLVNVKLLINAANSSLHLLHNKQSTLALLKQADQLLIETSSEQQLPLRQKIASDIASVEQFQPIDTQALSTTITKLQQSIPPLTTQPQAPEEPAKKPDTPSEEAGEEIQDLSGSIKQYIKRSISLRKTSEQPKQLLAALDKERINQLIQLRLESLRLMLLQRHDKDYHWQIQQLTTVLTQYYPEQQAKLWITELQLLNKARLNIPAPILTSIQQITGEQPQ